MRMFRVAWAGAALAVVIPCFGYDLVSGGSLRLAVLGPVMAAFGAMLGFVFADDRDDRWVWARKGALWLGLGAMTADALVSTGGGLGVLAGTLLLVLSSGSVRAARSQFLTVRIRGAGGPLEALSTRDLLRRWDWTTAEVLRGSTSPARRLVLVQQRQGLLDELQRRDADLVRRLGGRGRGAAAARPVARRT